MKHPLLVVVMVLMLLTGSLSACNLGTPECLEMPAPEPINPGGPPEDTWLAPGTPLTFRWIYSGSCQPDQYRIIVSRIMTSPYDVDMGELAVIDETVTTAPPALLTYEDGRVAYATRWESGITLPAGIYYWRVIPYSGGYSGERSEWRAFQIQDFCSSDTLYTLAPRPIYPRYGQTVVTLSPHVYWLDDNTCSLFGGYKVQVSEFSYFPEDATIESYMHYWTNWQVTGLRYCTRYYWRVSTWFAIVRPGPVSEVYYFDTASSDGSPCPADGTVPPTPTPAASSAYAVPLDIINCRTGPTTDFPLVSILPAGEQYEIWARNSPGDAWQVFDPAIGYACWVADDLVEVSGDTSHVMIIDPQPPGLVMPDESPETVDCSQWSSDQQACIANDACTWQPNLYPESPCRNK